MKYFILHCLLLFSLFLRSQDLYLEGDFNLDSIAVSEAKSALSKMVYKGSANYSDYDVVYHKLQWQVNPEKAEIKGVVTTHFKALATLDQIVFDLAQNMEVSRVSQRDVKLNFIHDTSDKLTVELPKSMSVGQLDSIRIEYQGDPVSSGFGSFEISTHGNSRVPVLWTLSEPYGAKAWWPCKQDLIDKSDSIDVFIEHPKHYKAASNGILVSEREQGDMQITHWKHRYPIPAYLIAIAVTNYKEFKQTVDGSGLEIVNYLYPENYDSASRALAVTPGIMNFYSEKFGEYPFSKEKYGHAQFGWSGGMEHTTMSFMGSWSRSLIAHELAHQWFGDQITCGSWQDIWLNEGFATYLDGLVVEEMDGENSFVNWRKSLVRSITSKPDGSVFVNDTSSVSRIFDSRLSYRKGAMVLHMLRYKLGDTDFFNGVRSYLESSDLAYSYAKTPDFKQSMEANSGKDLTQFFEDWIYKEGFPSYKVIWNQTPDGLLEIQVNQTQSHPSVSFFEMPLPITVIGTQNESKILRLEVSENGQYFSENLPFRVSSILVDPDDHIISKADQAVLGSEQEILDRNISVFPNPAGDYLYIRNESSIQIKKLIVYTIQGKKIMRKSNPADSIDLTRLSSGIYLIVIHTDQGSLRKMILKK